MQADEVVITATPELANLRNTKNLVDMLKKLAPERRAAEAGHQPGRHAEAAGDLAGGFLRAARHLADGGHPVRAAAVRQCRPTTGACLARWMPQNPIVQTISEIAHVLTGRAEIKAKKKAGFGSLLGRLKLKKK